jgi:hypothetical protein
VKDVREAYEAIVARLGLPDCHPIEGRAENKSNIWIIGIWILFLEIPSLG